MEGISKLFFETIKLVGNQFQHRGVDIVLRQVIQALKQESNVEATVQGMAQNSTFRALTKTLVLMVHYSTKEHFQGVCDMLLSELTSSVDLVVKTPEEVEQRWLNIAESMALINVCVSVRKANRIEGMRYGNIKLAARDVCISTERDHLD